MKATTPNELLNDDSPPRELCGYEFVRWLKPARTALCRTPQGRPVVLKVVAEDCLLEGTLHPDIKERLARIRELPHRTVATLISVERAEDGKVWAVWEYIDGTGFQTWVCDPMREEQHAARMLRELVIAVESMHGQGITHGALHDGNIVIDHNGEVRLLDVSPLLYSDEHEDVAAISRLLQDVLKCRCEATKAESQILSQVATGGDLRQLSTLISRAIQACDQAPQPDHSAVEAAEQRTRKLAMRAAIISAVVAVLLGAVLWFAFSDSSKAPPNAPPEALDKRVEK